MAVPFVPVFLALLLAYMVYSEWTRLDSRYLIAGALALLVVTAIVDAAGATTAANTLAEFVFFLLAGGVVLLLVDHVREHPRGGPGRTWGSGVRRWDADPTDPPEEGQRTADESLHGSQEQTVPLIDATGE